MLFVYLSLCLLRDAIPSLGVLDGPAGVTKLLEYITVEIGFPRTLY